MRLVKIGLASVNATVGAVRSNTDRCIAVAHAMAKDDVTIAVYPEQVIGGYAPEDLVQWRTFVASQRAELVDKHYVDSILASMLEFGAPTRQGRGAIDDKGSLVAIFEATETLIASGFQPKRTVIIVNGHDEEVAQTGAAARSEMRWRFLVRARAAGRASA